MQSELHHGSANNVARSDQIKLLIDFIKFEERDAVTNLVLGGKRHDLGQVRVVAPVRPVKCLFARDSWEQWDVDSVANQSHIDIVVADLVILLGVTYASLMPPSQSAAPRLASRQSDDRTSDSDP